MGKLSIKGKDSLNLVFLKSKKLQPDLLLQHNAHFVNGQVCLFICLFDKYAKLLLS